MIVCSSCLGKMRFCWMSLCGMMMFLVLGLSGLVLLRLLLLTLSSLLGVLSRLGPWFLGGVVPCLGLSDLVGVRFGRLVVMLLIAHDAADVFLYRDSSIALLLDMGRRFKAVMDVLDSLIRNGVSFARSFELTVQWDRILAAGPLYLVTLDDFRGAPGAGLGHFHHVVSGVHHRLSDFIHGVVVHRWDEAIRGWRNWLREDRLAHPYKWLRPDLVPPCSFFCNVTLSSLQVVLACWLILLGLMRNAERHGFPTVAVLGTGRPALKNSILRLMGGYPYCL